MFFNIHHRNFLFKQKCSPSSINMGQDIHRRAGKSSDAVQIVYDLKGFIKRSSKMKSDGKPYDPKTAKEAIARLHENSCGLIEIVEQYSWHIFKVIVRPLAYAKKELRLKSGKESETDRLEASESVEDRNLRFKQQQQYLEQEEEFVEEADRVFNNKECNLNVDPRRLKDIFKYTKGDKSLIKKGLQFVLTRVSTAALSGNPIANPAGLLVRGFKAGWVNDFDPYYNNDLPKFENMQDLNVFADMICGKPDIALA